MQFDKISVLIIFEIVALAVVAYLVIVTANWHPYDFFQTAFAQSFSSEFTSACGGA